MIFRQLTRTIFAFGACFLISKENVHAQVKAPQLTPLSPNTASLWKYVELPVNLYTGIPSISIPIFEAKSGNLKVPINLSYHAGGIRFEEQASWVGLGWTLNAGGAISRNVKGIADEKGILNPGNFYMTNATNCSEEYFANVLNKVYDVQPDEFSYATPEGSGRFVFRPGVQQPVTIPYQPFKFNYTNTNWNIPKFDIIDNNGTTFRYGNYKNENRPALEYSYGGTGGFTEEYYPSSWLLTEMESPDSAKKIIFNYAEGESVIQKHTQSQTIKVLDQSFGPNLEENCPSRTIPSIDFPSTSNLSYYTSSQYLSEILFENGKIQFVQSGNYRTDIYEHQRSLEYIKIFSLEAGVYKLIKTVKLVYSYFKKSENNVQQDWKLKLDKVQFLDADGIVKEEYNLQYTTNVFSADNNYAVDYWGYYNGMIANTNLIPQQTIDFTSTNFGNTPMQIGGANRNPNPLYMSEGVLQKITYPAGGYSEYEYETNKYSESGEAKYAGGLRIKKISSTTAVSGIPIVKTYKYGINGDGYGFKNFNTNLGFYVTSNRVVVRSELCASCTPNYYTVRNYNSMNSMQIDGADGSPVLYPYVTEYLGDVPTNIGRTEFIFDLGSPVSDNIALIYGPNTASFIRQSNSWQRGNLTKKSIFSSSNQLLSETINSYTILHEANLPAGMLLHEDDLLTCTTTSCVQFLGKNHYSFNYYTVKSGASKLGATTEKIYDPSDQTKSSSVNTSNLYDDNYLQPLQVTTETGQSEQVEKYFKYPFNYVFTGTPSGADAGGIKYLQDKNIASSPIEMYSVKRYLGTSPSTRITGGVLNTYLNGTPYPAKTLQFESNTPLTLISFGTGSSIQSNALSIPAVYKPKINYQYDGYGNVSEYQIDNGISNSFIWGYNRANVVAKVAGVTYSSISAIPGLSQTVIQNPASDDALRTELNKIRQAFPASMVTTYTYKPIIGITSETDPAGKTTFYEYDSFNRLKNIKDYQGNIIKNFQYNYASSCGANCVVLPMQTFNGSNSLGYPVGVFNVNGQLIGQATDQGTYVLKWNTDAANQAKGVLSAGTDALHFNLTLVAGQTTPTAVTGLRYYQFQLAHTVIDAIRPGNGEFIDFNDGITLRLGNSFNPNTLPAYTSVNYLPSTPTQPYIVHSYPNSNLKTLTIYHNDGTEYAALDNFNNPATSLGMVKNIQGNYPQFITRMGGSSYQQASMLTVANILNWNTITNITRFGSGQGDGINPNRNMNFAQDFMQYNKNLKEIVTSGSGYYQAGYRDLTFKISRLKSDWNTYFTELTTISISEDHWNHESLSALKKLSLFTLAATTNDHTNNATGPIPLAGPVIDNVLIQIAAGAGQTVANGQINIATGGTVRGPASDTAYNFLISKGWTINIYW